MKQDLITAEVKVPEGAEAKVEKGTVTVKGKKGEVKRHFPNPKVSIEMKDGKIIILARKATKKEKMEVNTCAAHIANMMNGAMRGHMYRLKLCSGHFPITITLSGKDFIVKNFLGEKFPRVLKLKEGASVKVEGDIITVESCSKELAGQTAASIEGLTRISDKDRRVFQDGIYITEMDGEPVR